MKISDDILIKCADLIDDYPYLANYDEGKKLAEMIIQEYLRNQWMPIDTAPMDRDTVIKIKTKEGGEYYARMGHHKMWEFCDVNGYRYGYWTEGDRIETIDADPIGWMPLAGSPEAGE